MSSLPFCSRLKINRDLLVTAALAQRNPPLRLQRETAEKEKANKTARSEISSGVRMVFAKTVSYPELFPVPFESIHMGDWAGGGGGGDASTGSSSSSQTPVCAAKPNTDAILISVKDKHWGKKAM